MRLHGDRKRGQNQPMHEAERLQPSGGNNEIWSFGDRVYSILKSLIELRERLRPYIHKHMEITSITGTPIMRPMFYDYPEDEICYTLGDQYMFGDDILFAPIVNQGQIERQVYLPDGTWVNVNDGKEYEGGRYVNARAELDQFIAYVKKGADVLSVFNI
jgi:alpha-D-xyloside xylohydrolase